MARPSCPNTTGRMVPFGVPSPLGLANGGRVVVGRAAASLARKANGAAAPSPRPGANVPLDESIVVASLDHEVARLFEAADHRDDALLGLFDLAHAHRARDVDVFAQHVGG